MHDVRRALFDVISSFDGNVECEDDMSKLIEAEFVASRKAFHVHEEKDQNFHDKVAVKLLNLFRIGRIGHYTIDQLPVKLNL